VYTIIVKEMNKNKFGSLEIIIGNMFSGKSTELIRRINTMKSINKKIVIINYLHDNRYSVDSISTHDSISVKSLKIENLLLIPIETLIECDCIFIDEGQFFNDLYQFICLYVDIYKKHMVVSGLDGDSNRKKFGQMLDIIPLADSVTKLKAYCNICSDCTPGPFTKKISNSLISTHEQIDIGGIDKYLPVCRYHYIN